MQTPSKCNCYDDATKHPGTLGVLARDASKVIAGRVTTAAARALGRYCSTHNCSQSEALRKALTILSSASDDPEATLSAVAVAIGLEPDASGDDVQKAIADLLSEIDGSTSSTPSDESADSVPPKPGTAPVPPGKEPPAKVSTHLKAQLAARGMTLAEFEEAKRAMPRTPSSKKAK